MAITHLDMDWMGVRDLSDTLHRAQTKMSVLLTKGMTAAMRLERDWQSPSWPCPLSIVDGPETIFGIKVEYVPDLPKQKVFDWSGCRSPARAKRRHARGYPQRVKIIEHDVAYLIDKRVLWEFGQRFDRMAVKAIMGE